MLKVIICALFLCSAAVCNALPVLLFENVAADVNRDYDQGQPFEFSVWISGLAGSFDDGGLDLGGFDIDLLFNHSAVNYVSTSFSPDLDDSLFFGLSAIETADGLNLSGVSLLFDLSAQPDEFKLFSFSFIANEPGNAVLSLSSLLFDSIGESFSADSNTLNISVHQSTVSVDEPSTFALLLIGLLLLCKVRNYSSRRQ